MPSSACQQNAEEDEVFRRRDLGQPRLLAPRLHPQEPTEAPHVLLHRHETGHYVELSDQLVDWPRGLLAPVFFNDTATSEIYTLSLHDALPIYSPRMIYLLPIHLSIWK